MNLEIKAKHFVGAIFTYPCACAISKAAMEAFPGTEANEGIDLIVLTDLSTSEEIGRYTHDAYDQVMFAADKLIADASTDPEHVIRTILLIKQETP